MPRSLNLNPEVKHLILSADTCGGIRNVTVALLYSMNKNLHLNLKMYILNLWRVVTATLVLLCSYVHF